MILTTDQLKCIWRGTYAFEENEEGYLISSHFTPEQVAHVEQANEFWIGRCRCTNSCALRFITDATQVSFRYKIYYQSYPDTIELFVDGLLTDLRDGETYLGEEQLCFELPVGEKEVTIHLPTETVMGLRDFTLNGSLKSVETGEKVLWMGDSITAGIGAMRSGHIYVNTAARLLGYEVLNQGLGGYRYDKDILTPMPGYTPDKIIVAFGTNQFTEEAALKDTADFYARLHQLYGSTPVLCITPIWREGPSDYVTALQTYGEQVKKICAAYPHITVVDGWQLLPHMTDYFCDGVHPTAFGHTLYGHALAEAIRKNGF